jgi:hypothetical protein
VFLCFSVKKIGGFLKVSEAACRDKAIHLVAEPYIPSSVQAAHRTIDLAVVQPPQYDLNAHVLSFSPSSKSCLLNSSRSDRTALLRSAQSEMYL